MPYRLPPNTNQGRKDTLSGREVLKYGQNAPDQLGGFVIETRAVGEGIGEIVSKAFLRCPDVMCITSHFVPEVGSLINTEVFLKIVERDKS